MKKVLKLVWNIILYIWQLPQNIAGLLVRLFYTGEKRRNISGITVYYLDSFPGGISLGKTIMEDILP